MVRLRTLVLIAAALLLLWLRRRQVARSPSAPRPEWFRGTAQESGDAARPAAPISAAGFASGLPETPPAAPAQPEAPSVEVTLATLAPPAPEPPPEAPTEGMLPFEVLDDMQGAGAPDAQSHGPPQPPAEEPSPDAQRPAADAPSSAGAPPSASASEEPDVLGGAGGRDDLLIIEGIGPRVNLIMEGAGITSFAQLAEAEVERLRQILRDNGVEVLNPETWPMQARLAAEGRLEELRELQGRIKNGRIVG